jgi:succinate dehydrogenase flavin-adding protein (antitoxin of CptAB toxin-antitoxin module)
LEHNLTLHYGILSGICENETEYLDKAEKLTKEIIEAEDWELADMFWGERPEKEKMKLTLLKIIDNIEKINKIPIEQRHYD